MATEQEVRRRIETVENRQYLFSATQPPEETETEEPIVYSDYSVWFKIKTDES